MAKQKKGDPDALLTLPPRNERKLLSRLLQAQTAEREARAARDAARCAAWSRHGNRRGNDASDAGKSGKRPKRSAKRESVQGAVHGARATARSLSRGQDLGTAPAKAAHRRAAEAPPRAIEQPASFEALIVRSDDLKPVLDRFPPGFPSLNFGQQSERFYAKCREATGGEFVLIAFHTHARAGKGDNGGLPPATKSLAQAVGWRIALMGTVFARTPWQDASYEVLAGQLEGCVVSDFGNEEQILIAAIKQARGMLELLKLRAAARGITTTR